MAGKAKPLIDRILANINKRPDTGCWDWKNCTLSGYGQVHLKKRGYRATHIIWEFFVGPIPAGKIACHRCDNKRCVNPDHIFWGTNKDNSEDMVAKGRSAKGSRHGMSKLHEDDVRSIKELKSSGLWQSEVAKFFSVSKHTIWRIWHDKNWRHV